MPGLRGQDWMRLVRSGSVRVHPNPVHLNFSLCAQPFTQLSCVLLYMLYVVNLKLQLIKWQPVETRLGVQIQRCHLFFHLLPA